MFVRRLKIAAITIAAGLGLSACADPYGYGGGFGGGYGAPVYGGIGGGWGDPYWGWNNGFYYPGAGNWVYGPDRRRFAMNSAQRRYWDGRRSAWRGPNRAVRQNWRDFRQDRRVDNRAFRQDRRGDRRALRNGQITRPEFRAERRDARRGYNRELRRDNRQLRRDNRQVIRRGGPGRGPGVRGPGRRPR